MNLSKFSVFTAVCCLIVLSVLILGCSDDDRPTSPKQYGWASLGTGMNSSVSSLTVYDNMLIAGGSFTTADSTIANRIAAWNGSSWTPLGTGTNSDVFALTVYNNKLIAGGLFDTAGGVAASNIAAWGPK